MNLIPISIDEHITTKNKKQKTQMKRYFVKLKKLAPIEVPAAYRIHVPIGTNYYHFFALRNEKRRVWNARLDSLVKNAHLADLHKTIELHELLVNSLFTATEVHALAQYYYDRYNVKIGVEAQPFPIPLPLAYTSIEVKNSRYTNPTLHKIGNFDIQLPNLFLAFLYDTCRSSEVWEDNSFDDFKRKDRSKLESIKLSEKWDRLPVEIRIYGYVENKGRCFLDELKGVHEQFSSCLLSEDK